MDELGVEVGLGAREGGTWERCAADEIAGITQRQFLER